MSHSSLTPSLRGTEVPARAPEGQVQVQGLRHGLLPARAPEAQVQGLRQGLQQARAPDAQVQGMLNAATASTGARRSSAGAAINSIARAGKGPKTALPQLHLGLESKTSFEAARSAARAQCQHGLWALGEQLQGLRYEQTANRQQAVANCQLPIANSQRIPPSRRP
jgi:hypothetical protein